MDSPYSHVRSSRSWRRARVATVAGRRRPAAGSGRQGLQDRIVQVGRHVGPWPRRGAAPPRLAGSARRCWYSHGAATTSTPASSTPEAPNTPGSCDSPDLGGQDQAGAGQPPEPAHRPGGRCSSPRRHARPRAATAPPRSRPAGRGVTRSSAWSQITMTPTPPTTMGQNSAVEMIPPETNSHSRPTTSIPPATRRPESAPGDSTRCGRIPPLRLAAAKATGLALGRRARDENPQRAVREHPRAGEEGQDQESEPHVRHPDTEVRGQACRDSRDDLALALAAQRNPRGRDGNRQLCHGPSLTR